MRQFLTDWINSDLLIPAGALTLLALGLLGMA